MAGSSNAQQKRVFDWESAYARLAKARAKLEASEQPSEADIANILRRRAIDYAKPRAIDVSPDILEVIEFEVAGARFAVELGNGAAATPLLGLTILPGVPPFYLGLLGYRGGVFPIVDIRPLLGRPAENDKDLRYAVLVRGERGAIGLAATDILGIAKYRSDRIAMTPEQAADYRAILGIGPNSTTIIDTTRLLQDRRLLVDDQLDVVIRTGGEGV